jgi:uncharacterized protein YeaO (DUF488 family)
MPIRTKRAYDPSSPDDGARYLVDRLWPRGVSSERLRLTAWRKELAPSDSLRRWFGHDPSRFEEFRRRYRDELSLEGAALHQLREEARSGTVTLVFGARDAAVSNAAVLAELLAEPDRTVTSSGSGEVGGRPNATGRGRGSRARAASGARARTRAPGPRTAPRATRTR